MGPVHRLVSWPRSVLERPTMRHALPRYRELTDRSGRQTGLVQEATQSRPELIVMPDHGVDIPVWHGPGSDSIGGLDAEELAALGVTDRLIERRRVE